MYEYLYENKNMINPFTYQPRKTTAFDLQGHFWTLQCNFGGESSTSIFPK
jgi:hypothetical protein